MLQKTRSMSWTRDKSRVIHNACIRWKHSSRRTFYLQEVGTLPSTPFQWLQMREVASVEAVADTEEAEIPEAMEVADMVEVESFGAVVEDTEEGETSEPAEEVGSFGATEVEDMAEAERSWATEAEDMAEAEKPEALEVVDMVGVESSGAVAAA